jgi:hypothetical protein
MTTLYDQVCSCANGCFQSLSLNQKDYPEDGNSRFLRRNLLVPIYRTAQNIILEDCDHKERLRMASLRASRLQRSGLMNLIERVGDPRSRMGGWLPSLHLYSFAVWCSDTGPIRTSLRNSFSNIGDWNSL